jgi:sarcosine oxidase subunit beta
MKPLRKMEAQVVVIGGGIVGCASAYYLARRGIKVILLEKDIIGGQASGRNGGGVRQQCRDRRERPLAIASVKLWEHLSSELDVDIEYMQGGNIRLATNEERMEALRREGDEELEDGLNVEVWNRDELRRRAPYLGDVFIGAKYCATDGTANPILTTRALAWAAQRYGAHIYTHTPVHTIHVSDGRVVAVGAYDSSDEIWIETPWVINAAGPWAPSLSQTIGVPVPVEPSRSVIAITQRRAPLFREFISSHDLGVYARQARAGQVHVGGTNIPAHTFEQDVPAPVIEHLARGIAQMVPALKNANFLRVWAGTLEMTPDKIPILGPVDQVQGYLLATGFSGHGFCLGPIAGKLLSELIVDGEPSLSLHAFRLARFSSI